MSNVFYNVLCNTLKARGMACVPLAIGSDNTKKFMVLSRTRVAFIELSEYFYGRDGIVITNNSNAEGYDVHWKAILEQGHSVFVGFACKDILSYIDKVMENHV